MLRDGRHLISVLAWAAIAKYLRLSDLNNKLISHICASWEVQDQGAQKVGFILKPLLLVCRQLPSLCMLK